MTVNNWPRDSCAAVLAPSAARVAVEGGSTVVPLHRQPGGWWVSEPETLHAGDDYWFHLDDRGRFPDPQSRWQPHGVHGPSRVLDCSTFPWSDDRWQAPPLSSAVIYELHVGTFTPEGTFDAAAGRLPYLADLGVRHVELMPVAAFHGVYGWGYDGVFPFAPHEPYGGPHGLRRFVDRCHAAGLAVILDVVYNHFGPVGNYLPQFGPYLADRHQTPWGQSVNLDGPDSGEVRRYFLDNARMWFRDYHMDGLRLDAVHALMDLSARHFLEELAYEKQTLERSLGKHLCLIAESDLNDPRLLRSPDAGGYGLDAQWADDVHHAVHTTITRETSGYYQDYRGLQAVAQVVSCPFAYTGEYSACRRRRHGRAPLGLGPDRFVVCLQNHDQIGNRARGKRVTQLTSLDRTKIGAALVILSPYIPLLFQGEEWGASTPFPYFADLTDEPDLARAVREGRLAEFCAFGWCPEEIPGASSPASFESARLKWEEFEHPRHAGLWKWYRALLHLRRHLTENVPDFSQAGVVESDAEAQWLTVRQGTVLMIINLSERPQTRALSHQNYEILLASADPRLEHRSITLLPESVVVLQPNS